MNRWLPPETFAAFAGEHTNAHRVLTSSQGWVERLGEDILISHKTDAFRDLALGELPAWAASVGFAPNRVFARFLPRQNAERISPVLVTGDSVASLETVVTERGVGYGLDFNAGYAAGLFIDQRENRSFLRSLAPRRVLNTFAYTCSFSVVAALAGAETLSLDLSKKSLERGRKNFALNRLPLDGHRFLADDVMDVLPRLQRRCETFDALILDPPTFSLGAGGRRWRVEDQIDDLLRHALELAAPGAWILLSTNCTKLERPALERAARFALKTVRRRGEFHSTPALADYPPGEGARTLWVQVG